MKQDFFELQHIGKYFAKVIANRDVSISIGHGEVLALLGENGAGKSTVMKILYGLYRADEGRILKEGREIAIHSPKDAMKQGIAMIQQHFSLVPAHTVTENIILGNVHGVIDRDRVRADIQALCDRYGFEIDPDARVRDLAVGVQQKVEILKALYQNAKLLIMDEPTAVLTPQEAEQLISFVRAFAEGGNACIFITHKMKEVMRVADRIVVMRAGEVSGDLQRTDTDEQELSRLMVGRDLPELCERAAGAEGEGQGLALQDVRVVNSDGIAVLDGVSLTVGPGEILGVAGVSGNGQKELCELVAGAISPDEGTITFDAEDVTRLGIRERIEAGVGYVPADRASDGMVMDMSVSENMMLKTSHDPLWRRHGFLNQVFLRELAERAIEDYCIKAPGADAAVRGLSGGNQQKVILAREVRNGEKMIVFDQPTRGLDLGAVQHIHQVILDERAKGKSILLVSTELSEIFALSDRIAVLYKGRIQGVFARGALDMESIGLLMAGYVERRCSPDGCETEGPSGHQ